MLKRVLNLAETRTRWFLQSRELRHVADMTQFEDYVARTQPKEFLRYRAMSSSKRTEFRAVVDAMGVGLKGLRFLDVGPAYGDALDICHEEGAKIVSYRWRLKASIEALRSQLSGDGKQGSSDPSP